MFNLELSEWFIVDVMWYNYIIQNHYSVIDFRVENSCPCEPMLDAIHCSINKMRYCPCIQVTYTSTNMQLHTYIHWHFIMYCKFIYIYILQCTLVTYIASLVPRCSKGRRAFLKAWVRGYCSAITIALLDHMCTSTHNTWTTCHTYIRTHTHIH